VTPRYRLRTLLILLALLPPLLWVGWGKYQAWRAEQARREQSRLMAQQRALSQLSRQASLAALRAQEDAERAKIAAEQAALEAQREAALARIETRPRATIERMPVVSKPRYPRYVAPKWNVPETTGKARGDRRPGFH
jgi:hypothetical protein